MHDCSSLRAVSQLTQAGWLTYHSQALKLVSKRVVGNTPNCGRFCPLPTQITTRRKENIMRKIIGIAGGLLGFSILVTGCTAVAATDDTMSAVSYVANVSSTGSTDWEATATTCAALDSKLEAIMEEDRAAVNAFMKGSADKLAACKQLKELPQCRVNAITARMAMFGLKDGDYVIGESRIDPTLPAFVRTGSLGFGKDGEIVKTRKVLAEVFTSTEPHLKAVADSKVAQFADQYPREVVLDTDNWEVVQYLVSVDIPGNTGLSGGTQVSLNTSSDPGDAEWLFIDPAKCVVATANFTSMGTPVDPSTPEADKPVGSIRPGCVNPTDGLRPKDWKLNVKKLDGVTQLESGDLTDDQVSEDQKASGQTSGNIINNNQSGLGNVTSDLGSGGGYVADGAGSGGDDISNNTTGVNETNHDNGGTNGDTHITMPAD